MWAQLANACIGIWLMASPALLDQRGAARVNDLIIGPLTVTVALVALSEVCRGVGKLNLILGLSLVVAPWALGYQQQQSLVNSIVS